MDFVERVVLRLRDDSGFSRNRHFATFASPEGRRALRIHRHFRSIERDLRDGFEASVGRDAERVRITLVGKRGRRTSWLTPGEFRLLCAASPLAREALAPQGSSMAPSR
jgi:hypothetical protein